MKSRLGRPPFSPVGPGQSSDGGTDGSGIVGESVVGDSTVAVVAVPLVAVVVVPVAAFDTAGGPAAATGFEAEENGAVSGTASISVAGELVGPFV